MWQWCSIESDTYFLVYEWKSRLSMTKNSDFVWSKHWAFCNQCRNASYHLSFQWTRWARCMMQSWRKWTLCLNDWSDTSLSFEACDWTSDIVCFKRVFLHRSTQFCDHRNDAMIVNQSLLDWRHLDSRDIQRRAWFWLTWELQHEKAHADSLLQTCFQQ